MLTDSEQAILKMLQDKRAKQMPAEPKQKPKRKKAKTVAEWKEYWLGVILADEQKQISKKQRAA